MAFGPLGNRIIQTLLASIILYTAWTYSMTAQKEEHQSNPEMQSSLKNVVVVGGSYVGIVSRSHLLKAATTC